MAANYWKQLRDDCKNGRGTQLLSGEAAASGIHTLEVYHKDFVGPIAVVWFIFSGLDRIEILNSNVDERLRRCGLRTMIHKCMLRFYPTRIIVSSTGSKLGIAWMKAAGYKQAASGWEYRKHLGNAR